MDLSRRDVLRLGGISAAAALFSNASASTSAPKSTPIGGDPASPLDERYLAHGLDLLCNAHTTDSFFTGHAGGAVISAYYLCREEELEPGAAETIQLGVDRHYGLTASPFPEEKPIDDGVATILRTMEDGIEDLTRTGHDVIFLSLALRAMHDLPAAVTPARIAGLRQTLTTLEPRRKGKGTIRIPEPIPAFAELVLDEFLGSTEGGPGQGFAGHLLTHGRAIVDLRNLGHEEFAQKCLNAYQLAVAEARPRSPRKGYREARPKVEFVTPDRKQYWERRVAAGSLELGHLFKYLYGFLGLRRLAKNPELSLVCTANSYRLFKS